MQRFNIQASREAKKKRRDELVKEIIVTVDGIPFDGDELSQERMARAIIVLNPLEVTYWNCEDNVVREVTREQLSTALRLAGEAQTNLWFIT
jgi:hypothetical protein